MDHSNRAFPQPRVNTSATMEGKQPKSRSAKTPTSRPHLTHQAQSSPIQLPSHRQQLRSTSTPTSTPTSLPHQRPQSHSTNHSFVTTPEFQSASGFDYDDLRRQASFSTVKAHVTYLISMPTSACLVPPPVMLLDRRCNDRSVLGHLAIVVVAMGNRKKWVLER